MAHMTDMRLSGDVGVTMAALATVIVKRICEKSRDTLMDIPVGNDTHKSKLTPRVLDNVMRNDPDLKRIFPGFISLESIEGG